MHGRTALAVRCVAIIATLTCGTEASLAQQTGAATGTSDDHHCTVTIFDAKGDPTSGTVRFVLGGPTLEGSSVDVAFVTAHTLYGATLPNVVVASRGRSAVDDVSPLYAASVPDVGELDGVYVSTVADANGTKHSCDITNGLPADALPYKIHLPSDLGAVRRATSAGQTIAVTVQPIAQFKTFSCSKPFVAATIRKVVPPYYPDSARVEGASGDVVVQVSLDSDGNVVQTSISSSSGRRDLDEAARDSATRTTYNPAISECIPVGGTFPFRVAFSQD